MKSDCRRTPCHSPEELRRRASRPGIPIDEIVKEIAREIAAKSKR